MRKSGTDQLIQFQSLRIEGISIGKNKISANYQITDLNGKTHENRLIYKYEEDVFDPKHPASQNLASIIIIQVGINYGLFSKEITFDGLYDDADKRFILDMIENTAREIYVNKILLPNEFLSEDFKKPETVKKKRFTNAKINFTNTQFTSKVKWEFKDNKKDEYIILSSGGKDSLLSYGICKEISKKAHPVYINESGKHWFSALNSYRYSREKEPNTARVWCNSDRIFNWFLRHMPIIRKDFDKVKADNYPIRLWTVAVFLFGALPLAHKRKVGRILIGNEYDTSLKTNYNGITHYSGYYDQSKYFDNALTRYYLKKGWNINQFSILRCLSEILILKILTQRFPGLQRNQISCHAAHEQEGRIYPCGKCEKCRRIVGMLKALDEDPAKCGYTSIQIQRLLKDLTTKTVKQIATDASHLYYLLQSKGVIESNSLVRKQAKQHNQIEHLRFDVEKSNPADMPIDVRKSIFKIYLKYAEGAVRRIDRKWVKIDPFKSNLMDVPYPFEVSSGLYGKITGHHNKADFLWENLTWQEIEERLKTVDTAILPCGAIEQHGPHLPVDIDYFDAVYLASKVAQACSDPKPFVLPAIPYGVSYHHEDFAGTLSISNEALSKMVHDLGMNLAKNGIKKLIILNGHGDNTPTLTYAAQTINRDAHIFVCVETGETSDTDINKLVNVPNDIHAGAIETSTTLAIRPEKVKLEKAKDVTLNFGSSYMDYSSLRGVPWYVRTRKISSSGILGNPSKASPELGKKIWEIMIAHLVKFVEEIKNSKLEDLYQRRY